mgnify:CR=1 FL=1
MILINVIVTLVVATACILVYHFALNKGKSKGHTGSGNCVDNVLDSMPALYYLEEMVCDADGKVVDLKIVKANKQCQQYVKGGELPIGKYSSEFFPDGQDYFIGAANSAKQINSTVNFQYYEKSSGVFYDCVARQKSGTNCIEFFLIDSTNLHNAQKALGELRMQMESALEVSHVTPLKMYVDTQLITFMQIEESKRQSGGMLKNVTATGDEVFARFAASDRNQLRQQLDELVAGNIDRVKFDMQCMEDRGNGMQIEWYEVRAVVGERKEDGTPKILEGSIQLVTKRKELEQKLVDAKKKAEDLNSLKSAFLANMSHEIRTPLNAIVGFSELLIDAESKEQQEEYSRIIQANSGQLLQLVNDILDLSKIEAGTMEFIDHEFELNTVLKEAEESLRLRLDTDKPVELKCEYGLPKCTLHLDNNRLSQVITNLVTNAIKYTERGTITMGYKQEDKHLLFYVKDTGVGINPKHINDIFDRFVKLNAFMKGNGLGLSICRSIVDRFGGKIWAESKEGEGSTFFFTIPYDQASQPVVQPKPVEPKPVEKPTGAISHKQTPDDKKPRILVAEDNESNYRLLHAILSREYNLYHAWNGKEAVEAFDEFMPKLVIMDINMPVMDGYEASALIKQKSPQTPILALTAYATAADEEKILASGMDAYMAKPVCMPQLRLRLKDLLKAAEK